MTHASPAQILSMRAYYKKNRKSLLVKHKDWRVKNRKHNSDLGKVYRVKLFALFAQEIQQFYPVLECCACGAREIHNSKFGIYFHEIHGRPHDRSYKRFRYILTHISDFAPTCSKHHSVMHRLLEQGLTWKEIITELHIEVITTSKGSTYQMTRHT